MEEEAAKDLEKPGSALGEARKEHPGTKNLLRGQEYRKRKKEREEAAKAEREVRLAAEAKLEVPPLADVGEMLREDMHFVYTMPESRDDTEGKKRCRSWLQSNPVAFLNKLEGMAEEIERRRAAEAEAKAGPVVEAEKEMVDESSGVAEGMYLEIMGRKPWLRLEEVGDGEG